jgi:hypothetical protein
MGLRAVPLPQACHRATASQGAAGSWRHEAREGGTGQGLHVKSSWLPAASKAETKQTKPLLGLLATGLRGPGVHMPPLEPPLVGRLDKGWPVVSQKTGYAVE